MLMRQQPANSIVWKNGPKQGKLDTYEYLSNFLGILYRVLDPEIFILSGSVALKIPGFIEEVEKRTKEKVYDALKENIKIVPAALGEDCGLVGAACLLLQDPS